jgi:hypothetical protein
VHPIWLRFHHCRDLWQRGESSWLGEP